MVLYEGGHASQIWLSFFEEVTKTIDEGRAVDVVYMNFSKAFDKVPHGRLVQKVKSHGIKGEPPRWVENLAIEDRG